MSSMKNYLVAILLLCSIVNVEGAATYGKYSDAGTMDSLSQSITDRIILTERQVTDQNKAIIDSLKPFVKGSPVLGVMDDTIFDVYSKLGSSTPSERAKRISKKIKRIYRDELFRSDSLIIRKSDYTTDIVYGDIIVMGISDLDALWYGKPVEVTANELRDRIEKSILLARKNYSLMKLLSRIGLVITVIASAWLIIWLIGRFSKWLLLFLGKRKDTWLRNLSYKDYTFLTSEKEYDIIKFLLKMLRWILYAILLYITLPVIFSIFPFTRGWANSLFSLIWTPFRGIIVAIWNYLPSLFSIIVIVVVIRLFLRFIKYIFREIEEGRLKIAGFHTDWAMPTFGIVRFLLYAFMIVLIFPHLPGSDSPIFKGVSVLLGVLFSLGSSSVIANMVAGLVITYMRPFKTGDRIKIGDISGDVIEKTMLVTRIKTPKNEEITIPNTAILTGSTTNYSTLASENGVIVYTTVTIGYDVPWRDMHRALVDAALRTDLLLKEPSPYVLQTSLDDFYVSYQLNAYTKTANMIPSIYSDLHQNIQDVCNERDIEIMSPHYRSARDGNKTTIPANYRPQNYKPPEFNVRIEDSSNG
jgi:small-conductance mechanosensitive channel